MAPASGPPGVVVARVGRAAVGEGGRAPVAPNGRRARIPRGREDGRQRLGDVPVGLAVAIDPAAQAARHLVRVHHREVERVGVHDRQPRVLHSQRDLVHLIGPLGQVLDRNAGEERRLHVVADRRDRPIGGHAEARAVVAAEDVEVAHRRTRALADRATADRRQHAAAEQEGPCSHGATLRSRTIVPRSAPSLRAAEPSRRAISRFPPLPT